MLSTPARSERPPTTITGRGTGQSRGQATGFGVGSPGKWITHLQSTASSVNPDSRCPTSSCTAGEAGSRVGSGIPELGQARFESGHAVGAAGCAVSDGLVKPLGLVLGGRADLVGQHAGGPGGWGQTDDRVKPSSRR